MTHNSRICLISLLAVLLLGNTSIAQSESEITVNPAAEKAFKELLKSYRQHPAIIVKIKLKVQVIEGETKSQIQEKEAEFVYTKSGPGVVKLDGLTCYFNKDVFSAIHKETEDSYYTEEYEDNPYWVLLRSFKSLPYPHIGLFWGEDKLEDVYMQLYPDTENIVPSSVENLKVDKKNVQRITFSSSIASMKMDIDPKKKLITKIVHEVTGGDFVQPGTKKVTTYTYKYEIPKEPLNDALVFNQGDRQVVDVLGMLMPQPPAPEPVDPADLARGAIAAAGGLEGKAAPAFDLQTAQGQQVNLEELAGQVVVLDFWATWCGPCRQALPLLHNVGRWAKDEQLPVKIYTVNVWERGDTPKEKLEAATAFWKKQGFTLPIAMDYTDKTAAAYGVTGIPTTVIIRSDGVVHEVHVGAGGNYEQMMKHGITEAIKALEADDD